MEAGTSPAGPKKNSMLVKCHGLKGCRVELTRNRGLQLELKSLPSKQSVLLTIRI